MKEKKGGGEQTAKRVCIYYVMMKGNIETIKRWGVTEMIVTVGLRG